jgi:ABC-type transport system involved in multi-copper enzyme maturation permease subunit
MIIAGATFREMLGRRVLMWGGVLSTAFLGLFTLGLVLISRETTFGEIDAASVSILTMLGLYIVSFLGSFLGLVLSAGSVASEVDGGFIHAVVARPISRPRWLLERWAAIASMVATYTVIMGWSMMSLSRLVLDYAPLSTWRTLALMALQSVVMVTLGVLLSTRLSAVATGVVLFALFGLAWMGGIVELIGRGLLNDGMMNAGIVTSLIMPTDGLWQGASYYASSEYLISTVGGLGLPFSSADPPATPFVLWSIAYTAFACVVAVRRFASRDL